jgi:glyoxylase-like metal-dependent hydrolase (beta-lactamase superfamily II)
VKVKILGSRANIEPSEKHYSKHSGALIDEKLMLDLGEQEYLDLRPEYVFITHLHPDHAFFINYNIEKIDVPVYTPESSEELDVEVLKESIKVDGYRVTSIPTHHSKLVESQAYLVEKNSKRILYTGDIIWINKEHHENIKDLDLVITDASYLRKGGLVRKDKETGRLYGHNGIPDLVNLFKGFTNHIIFMHFGSWFYKNIEESKEKIRGFSDDNFVVEPAYDGFEVEV